MLKRNHGIDIVMELGWAQSCNDAYELFEEHLSPESLKQIRKISDQDILIKIANAISQHVNSPYISTGSESDKQFIKSLCIESEKKGSPAESQHTLSYDLKEEQSRIIDRTYYIDDSKHSDAPCFAEKMRKITEPSRGKISYQVTIELTSKEPRKPTPKRSSKFKFPKKKQIRSQSNFKQKSIDQRGTFF